MDKYYLIDGRIYFDYNRMVQYTMDFEWDDDKNLTNIEKHGVSFEDAMAAFLDPKRKIRLNTKHSSIEMRYYCLGMVENRVLTVRFLVRNGKVRIIGAGYWREGKKLYEQEQRVF